jgi:hypothetical protein
MHLLAGSGSTASSRDAVLTHAVQAVLQRAPASLPWQQLTSSNHGQPQASFEAVGSDGHLYSINLLDGTVLLDGAPPSRLPLDILQHPLYLRTFGDSNFEVASTTEGVLQTIRSVKGRHYNFYLAVAAQGQGQEQQELVVVEVDGAGGVEMQLLDVGEGSSCGAWGAELPERWRKMHSHWLCR